MTDQFDTPSTMPWTSAPPSGPNPWLVGSLSALTALVVGGLVGFFAGFGTATYQAWSFVDQPYESGDYTMVELAFGESHTWDDHAQITIGEPEVFVPDPEHVGPELEGYDEFVRLEVRVHNPTEEFLYLEDDLMLSATTGGEYAEMYWSPEVAWQPSDELGPDDSQEFVIAFARHGGEEFVVQAETTYHWDLVTYS